MSPKDRLNAFNTLSETEKMISKSANSCTGVLTPNRLMKCLKLKSESKTDGLTQMGKLIESCLIDSSHLDVVRWVVFHFDLPTALSNHDELATRNWISVRCSEQDILNEVHRETIGKGAEHIDNIYAPSIVASKIKDLKLDSAEEYRAKWWLYRFDSLSLKRQKRQLENCRMTVPSHPNILCFSCDDSRKLVNVILCGNDVSRKDGDTTTLGKLLGGEDETKATKKFINFAKLIYHRNSNGFDCLCGADATIRCNFYARIPVFFYLEPKRFMTEIFVAFQEDRNDISTVVQILCQIEPALRICVSLINSQIAYAIANHIRTRSMAGLLHAVLRHDLKNLGEAVDAKAGLLLDNWQKIIGTNPERVKRSLLEIRANVELSLMATELDILWRSEQSIRPEITNISDLKHDLDKAWRFSDIKSCRFEGDWDHNIAVPKVCRVVLSNLLRNALVPPENDQIVLHCTIQQDRAIFGCLSVAPFPKEAQERYFMGTLSLEIPSEHRGLWICRHIAEKLLNGRLYLGEPKNIFMTNIRFEFLI